MRQGVAEAARKAAGDGRPSARTCSIEAHGELPAIDLAAAERWLFLVTAGGTPCAYVNVPSPGKASGRALTHAVVVRHADRARARARLVDELRRRMGAPSPTLSPTPCSVVVCTHRRRGSLGLLFEGLLALDPPPAEVIVVDNDPGPEDCRADVEAAGFHYLREDRRGLNRARTAGLRAARGQLVAFTDDDCVPPPSWLRSLPGLFADPSVAAVTGPAVAHSIDTPAKEAREKYIHFHKGFERRVFDWTVVHPVNGGAVGAGASMVFLRAALEELGEVFPPELDGGTPTCSGGDLYALYRVLAAGHRVVYDPATYVFHRHAADAAALHRTAFGYGVGFSSFLAKALVEHREPDAFALWPWVLRNWREAVLLGLIGEADPGHVRLRWNYLRGSLRGPLAWPRARRRAAREGAGRRPRRKLAARDETLPAPRLDASEHPSVSVILSGPCDPDRLERSVAAVACSLPQDTACELIVARPPHGGRGESLPFAVREVTGTSSRAGCRNAGAAAARGRMLIFLDAGLIACEGLIERHLRLHSEGAGTRLVLGHVDSRPAGGRLASLRSCAWWRDQQHRRHTATALTFADVSLRNASLPREALAHLGPLDASLPALRADWEWGMRALEAGLEACDEPAARATEELALGTRQALGVADRNGRADAALLARRPSAAIALPPWESRRKRIERPVRALAVGLLRRTPARRVAALALAGLERGRARSLWLRLFQVAELGAYEQGFLEAGGVPHDPAAQLLRVELRSADPIPAPRVAASAVELRLDGRPLARLRPPGGQWAAALAEQAAALVEREAPAELIRVWGPSAADELAPDLSGTAVLLGPARQPGDDSEADALRAAGARVSVIDGDPRGHWPALDRAIRESHEQAVGLPLPGVAAGPAWLRAARPPLEGDRVAAMVGAGLREGEPLKAVALVDRRSLEGFKSIGRAPQFIAVRPELYRRLGGLDLETARFGPHAPLLDLLDRAGRAGLVVGYRDTPGLDPPGAHRPARSRNEWLRWQAKGALRLRRARAIGGARGTSWFVLRGLGPRVVLGWRSLSRGRPTRRHWLGTTAAFAYGCLLAVRAGGQSGQPRYRLPEAPTNQQ